MSSDHSGPYDTTIHTPSVQMSSERIKRLYPDDADAETLEVPIVPGAVSSQQPHGANYDLLFDENGNPLVMNVDGPTIQMRVWNDAQVPTIPPLHNPYDTLTRPNPGEGAGSADTRESGAQTMPASAEEPVRPPIVHLLWKDK